MDNTNIVTGAKAEDRMVLTMTTMEADAIKTALMVVRNDLRTANAKAIKDFEHLAPGSEEEHDACNTLMRFLICQSVVEETLDCINDFMEKQKVAET